MPWLSFRANMHPGLLHWFYPRLGIAVIRRLESIKQFNGTGLTLVCSTGGSQCQLRHAIVLRGTLRHAIVLRGTLPTRAVSSVDFDEGLFTRGRFAGGMDMRGVGQPSGRR
jgi:hypothetical protein